jgi:hypothetical protein
MSSILRTQFELLWRATVLGLVGRDSVKIKEIKDKVKEKEEELKKPKVKIEADSVIRRISWRVESVKWRRRKSEEQIQRKKSLESGRN